MTEQSEKPSLTADKRLELCAEYWTKRLDHTLTHTQTSSRLIYLIDGAVLAFVYFVLKELREPLGKGIVITLASISMLALSILNVMHAHLIERQRLWYKNIDKRLREMLSLLPVWLEEDKDNYSWWNCSWWKSTHNIYKAMHWVVAVALLIMTILMVLDASGFLNATVGAPQWLNSIGLVLSMIGVIVIFFFGPPQPNLETGTPILLENASPLPGGGTAADRDQDVQKKRIRYSHISKGGLLLIFFGFAFQLLAALR